MPSLVIDIESIGQDVADFDEMQTEFWFKFAKDEAEEERLRESTAFYALTGEVVCIACFNPDTHKGKVLGRSSTQENFSTEEAEFEFFPDEASLLKAFWQLILPYPQLVTFNGRVFDFPFLLLRSAINRVKPTRNIMPNRYGAHIHCDLADQLRFYGAIPKAFPLHFYCHAFNIPSPKTEMSGKDVKPYFLAGKHKEIATYCLQDTVATAALFDYWRQFLVFG